MAPKKSKNAVMDRGTVVVLRGTPVLMQALGGSIFECSTCGRKLKKGIVYRLDTVEYCSRGCFPPEQ